MAPDGSPVSPRGARVQKACASCTPNHQITPITESSILIRIHATAHTPGAASIARNQAPRGTDARPITIFQGELCKVKEPASLSESGLRFLRVSRVFRNWGPRCLHS